MKGSFIPTRAYFDCNATTPVLPLAAEAALEAMQTLYGNPSSSHLVGLQAKFILESTRKTAAKVIGTDPEQIIFTSCATEAIQTSVFSVLNSFQNQSFCFKPKLLFGATEHKAISQALYHWVKVLNLPFEVLELPVDSLGQLKLDILRRELPHAVLLCTMAVNNETGVIQDLTAIEAVLNEAKSKTRWLVDCVQALGKVDLRLNSCRIDYAAFSGHKLYAPKGIGFLYVKKDSPLIPLIVGGGQEKGFRSGTENLPGVAALGAVLGQLLDKSGNSVFHPASQLLEFRDKLVLELKRAFPKIEFNTPFDRSVPTTINFSVPGFSSSELIDLFDAAGMRMSAGSACSATSAKPSYVLDAMGVSPYNSVSALRLSFGSYTAKEEIERGCQVIQECATALKNACVLSISTGFEAPENLRDGIVQFRVGPVNSWIFADREARSCIIIDPHETIIERMEQYVRCQKLTVLAMLDTHSHGDHQTIRPVLKRNLAEQMENTQGDDFDSLGWPIADSKSALTVTLDNDEVVPCIRISSTSVGELVLARMESPGHTDDSTALLLGVARSGHLRKENVHFVFSGDTVLSGGLGRTNFSVSNPVALFNSLRSLQEVISPVTLVCPSHDYNNSFATTLRTEIAENSLLELALGPMTPLTLDLFLDRKIRIDQELVDIEKDFQGIVCGVTPAFKTLEKVPMTLSIECLPEYLANRTTPIVADVRESHEFLLFKDWSVVGLKEAPRNIPLSRFVNFMDELLASKDLNQEVLLICKTGRRSLQAVKSLRKLGFTRVWNLDGGVALSGQT